MQEPLLDGAKENPDSENSGVPKPEKRVIQRSQTKLDVELEEMEEDARLNKYHRRTRVIYEYGDHPVRYVIGTIYSLQCLYIGLSTNPITPMAVAVSRVRL